MLHISRNKSRVDNGDCFSSLELVLKKEDSSLVYATVYVVYANDICEREVELAEYDTDEEAEERWEEYLEAIRTGKPVMEW